LGSELRDPYEPERPHEPDRMIYYSPYGGPTLSESFAGRGPKGYQRSDDRIREDVCERLAGDSIVDASDMEVTVADGEVTLSGSAHARAEKRRAEDIVEHVSGVRDVQNQLRLSKVREEP
jgi:osmotically-inducible protein OsmY